MKLTSRSLLGLLLLSSLSVHADEVKVAVAANFLAPLQEIVTGFTQATAHTVTITSGATGQLFTQIQNGAPFEVMISADNKTPKKLVKAELALADTQFTYARGQLVLWSADAALIDSNGSVLQNGSFTHLALGNPKIAPYGQAAMETLDKLGLMSKLQPRFVQGDNISQTKQFIDSGNAELGFIALSQVYKDGKVTKGSLWRVPHDLYTPLYQDAVLLKKGEHNPAATALLAYLRTDAAKAVMLRYGYLL